jgi:hypothetical protein
MREPEREVWTDHLFEKHECGPSSTEAAEIEVDGVKLRILLPRFLPRIEVVTAAIKGELLFILARIRAPKDWGVDGNGAVLVARRRDDGAWGVHVWHELYEWALGHLVPESGASGDAGAG